MPLIENVQEIILVMNDGKQKRLTPANVTKVPTRTTGAPMSEHGKITYWHIIGREPDAE